jgi:hypothetical protein
MIELAGAETMANVGALDLAPTHASAPIADEPAGALVFDGEALERVDFNATVGAWLTDSSNLAPTPGENAT